MKNYQDTLLLINNDPGIMTLFSIILGESGYNLNVALDKMTAFEIIRNRKVDLIILDMTFQEADPQSLLRESVDLRPDIPKIILVDNDWMKKEDITSYYPFLFDVVVKPIQNIEEFRMRVNRGIENYKLQNQNRDYQKKMIEVSFRNGLFDILSSIVSHVNNQIDDILADLLLWKNEFIRVVKDETALKKFNSILGNVSKKLLNIEEMIQLNEVLLASHPQYKMSMINVILKDIISIQKGIFSEKGITINHEDLGMKPTSIDPSRIARILFYFFERLIKIETSYSKAHRVIDIYNKITHDKDGREQIELCFKLGLDCRISPSPDHQRSILPPLEKDEILSLIESIGGSLESRSDCESNENILKIFFPVVEVPVHE